MCVYLSQNKYLYLKKGGQIFTDSDDLPRSPNY